MICSPCCRAVAAISPSLAGIVALLRCADAVSSPQTRQVSRSIGRILEPWSRSSARNHTSSSRRRLLSFRRAIPFEISPTQITLRKMSRLSSDSTFRRTAGLQWGCRSSETTQVSNRTLTTSHRGLGKHRVRHRRLRGWDLDPLESA
jgi:hypothetical protein